MHPGDQNTETVRQPRVSVLIPVYNREKVIAETIESILDQTFTDFELLICDDGSTDRSVQIISSFKDPRIRLLHNERNIGSSATRNRLVAEARGEFCAILDSDDIAYPYRLRKQVHYLDTHSEIDVCTGATTIIDEEGRETGRGWYRKPYGHEILKVITLFHCAVGQTTMMFRRQRFINAGLYYEPGPANDMGILKMAVHKLKFANLDVPLVKYRIWQSQMSTEKETQCHRALDHVFYQYDLLGLELTKQDKRVLNSVVDGSALHPDLAVAFEELAQKILQANKRKSIFDTRSLVGYMTFMYGRSVRLAKKDGIGPYLRCLNKYHRFKNRIAAQKD